MGGWCRNEDEGDGEGAAGPERPGAPSTGGGQPPSSLSEQRPQGARLTRARYAPASRLGTRVFRTRSGTPPPHHPRPRMVPMSPLEKKLAAALDSLIEQLAREFDDYQKPLRAIQKVLREMQA